MTAIFESKRWLLLVLLFLAMAYISIWGVALPGTQPQYPQADCGRNYHITIQQTKPDGAMDFADCKMVDANWIEQIVDALVEKGMEWEDALQQVLDSFAHGM